MTNYKQRLLSVVGIVGMINAGFCEPPETRTDKTPGTSTREPIPDDDAPDDLKRLITIGKVQVVYDSDPQFVKARCKIFKSRIWLSH